MLLKTLEKQQSRDTVKVIGSDSCSKNTGWDNGVQACVEEELGRPLQRLLCLKHTIEIIWHKYFIALDGETSSPTTLTGPIGKVVSGNSFFRSEIITYSTMRPKRPLPKLSKKVISQMSCDQAGLPLQD